MKRQATLFGKKTSGYKPYVQKPTNPFEEFMNKYLYKSDNKKTRQLVIEEGISVWNKKYKGI